MGKLQSFHDMTGKMNATAINATNISNMIDEFNRSQDLLDALSNTFKIINKGSGTIPWDGTLTPNPAWDFFVNVGTSDPFVFLCYYSRSDAPDNLYPLPDQNIAADGSYNYEMSSFTVGSQLHIDFNPYQVGTALTFTVYYFIILQPTNPTSG